MHEPHPNNKGISPLTWSTYAAVFAGVCDLLCFALINYNKYVVEIKIRHYSAVIMNYPEIVGECVYLAPLLVLIIFFRIPALVFPYVAILSIVAMRYLSRNFILQKFDWADLLFYLLGLLSLAIVFVWIAIRSAFVVPKLFRREAAR
jgi:hypothetical protein